MRKIVNANEAPPDFVDRATSALQFARDYDGWDSVEVSWVKTEACPGWMFSKANPRGRELFVGMLIPWEVTEDLENRMAVWPRYMAHARFAIHESPEWALDPGEPSPTPQETGNASLLARGFELMDGEPQPRQSIVEFYRNRRRSYETVEILNRAA